MTDDDMAFLRQFAFKVDTHITNAAFDKLKYVFPGAGVSSLKVMKARAAFLAAFKPVPYHCCINSCCCFVGPHKDCQKCPYFNEPHYNNSGKPQKQFTYSPIIPRLVALLRNPEYAKQMQYRGEHKPNSEEMSDIFDSVTYIAQLSENIVVDGRTLPHKFFEDLRDVALGLSTDGFAPFHRCKHTCWPLILFNYNLPPDIRFHLKHILCVTVIPGPKKPVDFDSFLWPLVEELLQLEIGVHAYDPLQSELFKLHAYLIRVFGDIPAVSMVMCMKGHNGFTPCRMCHIQGLQVPGSKATTHYVPLDRSRHPQVQGDSSVIACYDPSNLPLRTHKQFMAQAQEVQAASTDADAARLLKHYGIKGVPLLSYLSSLQFPTSFPYDFMHLIYENLLKNLISLWTGAFKGLDEGSGSYEFNPKVWEAIGAASAAAGSTVPGAFRARPRNVADDKTTCTADMWSFWMLYLGPVLLNRKF